MDRELADMDVEFGKERPLPSGRFELRQTEKVTRSVDPIEVERVAQPGPGVQSTSISGEVRKTPRPSSTATFFSRVSPKMEPSIRPIRKRSPDAVSICAIRSTMKR